jgi:hypothetical protein
MGIIAVLGSGLSSSTRCYVEQANLRDWNRRSLVRVGLSLAAFVVHMVSPSAEAKAYDSEAVSAMETKIVEQFCQEREWLRCFYEEPTRCEEIVKRFVKPCLAKVVQGQPPAADQQAAMALTQSTLSCFNVRFEEEHRGGKKNSPECAHAPAHLQ